MPTVLWQSGRDEGVSYRGSECPVGVVSRGQAPVTHKGTHKTRSLADVQRACISFSTAQIYMYNYPDPCEVHAYKGPLRCIEDVSSQLLTLGLVHLLSSVAYNTVDTEALQSKHLIRLS